MIKNKLRKRFIMGFSLVLGLFLLVFFMPLSVSAQTLVGDVIDTSHEFSRYPLLNYSLDFYVDNSGNWLPWNWGRGVGNAVMIGIFYLTNVLWSLTVMIAFATGYVVQEAFNLDFISTTAEAIGRNIQILSGVSRFGITGGFLGGFLLILILILGIYLAYIGLLKRETTKAFKAVLNFFMVFVVSSLVFVSAPTLIGNINDLSRDLSTEALRIGTSITMPNSDVQGHESTALIRNNLFSIQIIQPWKVLQFGTTDVAEYRVENIRSHAPTSSARQDAIENEVERRNNSNMSVEGLPSRLGTVIFLLLFNLGISAFVLLLSGIMIFSQVLFIVYAMFLPISFVLSMIPTFESMSKKAVVNLFNVVMMRAGITLVVTVAFSVATMLYGLAGEAPLFMIMFLQITTFAGIYLNLGKIMGMFSLQSNDSQSMSKNMTRNVQRSITRGRRSMKKAVIGGLVGGKVVSRANKRNPQVNHTRTSSSLNPEKQSGSQISKEKVSLGKKVGQTVGNVADAPSRVVDKAKQTVDEVKHAPTNLKYAAHQGKRNVVKGVSEVTQAFEETKGKHQRQRQNKRVDRIRAQAMKQAELNKEKSNTKSPRTQASREGTHWNQVSTYPPQTEKLTKRQLRQRQQTTGQAYEARQQQLQPNGNQTPSIQELLKQPRAQLTKPQLRQRQQATRKAYETRKQELQSKGSQKYSSQELFKQPRENLTKPQLRQRQEATRKAREAKQQQLQSQGSQKSPSQELLKQPREQLTKQQLRQRQQETRKARETRSQKLKKKSSERKPQGNLKQTRSQEKNVQVQGNKRTSTSKKMNSVKKAANSSPSIRGEVVKQVGESFKEKTEYKNKMAKNPAKRMRPTRGKVNLLRTVQSGQLPRRMGKR